MVVPYDNYKYLNLEKFLICKLMYIYKVFNKRWVYFILNC